MARERVFAPDVHRPHPNWAERIDFDLIKRGEPGMTQNWRHQIEKGSADIADSLLGFAHEEHPKRIF
jgi:hypothetical protein